MKKTLTALACALAFGTGGSIAFAASITTQTFDTDPVLSDTPAPGVWYTDRYKPAGFSSESFDGDQRLRLQLSEDDGAVDRPSAFNSSFYNTQGRKFDTPGATMLSIDMYIDQSFASDPGRIGGLWGTAVDAGNVISAYPIVEFIGGGFSVWDGAAFQAIGTPTGFSYDSWINIGVNLDTSTDMFTVFAGDASLTFGASGSKSFSNAILQGINTNDGINRDIYFDNFVASAPSPVPVPASLPILLSGLAIFGVVRRRRTA